MKIDYEPETTAVIIDPPRRGCDQKFINQLVTFSPVKVIYVSCNPATQAREVAVLCSEEYELVKLRPVDMFPHTPHIENVATLIRKKS